jgi:hypothetical protein
MMENINWLSVFCTGTFGIFCWLSELVNRYTSFRKVFQNIYSIMYMLINFIAAAATYLIIKIYKITIGEIGTHEIGICFFAGLGAMAFLRGSFFNYKNSNGQVVSIGPAALLTVFLRAAEMEFDRNISNGNIKRAALLMKDLNFMSASKDLPLIILASMRALSNEEQKALSDDILKLVNDTTPTTEAKNIAMGTLLIKYTEYELLETSVKALKEIYNNKMKPDLEKISTLQDKLKSLQLQ